MSFRITWIDTLKGLGIFMVVFAHTDVPDVLRKYIYSFHMPLFFFISGYLYSSKGYSFQENFKRKLKSLIVPYLIFTFISIAVMYLRMFLGSKNGVTFFQLVDQVFYLHDKVVWNTPLWFLVVLFIVDILFYSILFYCRNNSKLVSLVVLGFTLSGFVLSSYQIYLPLGFSISCVALSFYYLGNLSKNHNFQQTVIENGKYCINIILSLGLSILFGLVLNERVDMYKLMYGNYFFFYVASIAGIVSWIQISYIISHNKICALLGQSTLIILGMHYFVFYFISVIETKILKFSYHTEPLILIGLFDAIIAILVSILIKKSMLLLAEKYKICRGYV